MDQQLKQRLIGTTIVVSLAVIFVPLFFEDKNQPVTTGRGMEMTELPGTLEERPMELPRSAADAVETGKTESAPGNSSYRIVPMNDPPPKPAGRGGTAPGAGREMMAVPDEDFTIVDEGAGREQEAPATRSGGNSRATVYPLDPHETNPSPAINRSKPVRLAEPPLPLASKPPAARAPVSPEATKPQGEGAWMIQAGSFTGEANARNLVDKLRKSNFPAFVEVIPGESGSTMYRVRVGPELSKARAEQVKTRIESAVGIKGIIIPNQ
ncbi:MAG: SPOR domain-containing protein [Methylococcaceae bacterium]